MQRAADGDAAIGAWAHLTSRGSAKDSRQLQRRRHLKSALDVPIMWIPNSYGGCGQHGPNEHGLGSQFREGLELMAGVFWDSGELDAPHRKTPSAA